ncbi:MAG: hypothetical protein ABR929_02105 [Roseiarcus sp.]|jgi:hypothetical protein
MIDDQPRHDAPGTARPTATQFPLTLDDVSRLFDEAGLPRNVRTLQRYCAAGRLDCIKEETATGLAYFVDPASVERAIKQLAQLHGLTDEVRHSATSEATPRTVAHGAEPSSTPDTPRTSAANRDTNAEISSERQSAPESDTSGLVALLERENTTLREEKEFYRGQIAVKDTQIAALLERDRETNILVRGLQTMLAPLLGRGSRGEHDSNFDAEPARSSQERGSSGTAERSA